MTAIDLFCGAGGITIALQQSGFDILLSNEINAVFSQTHKLNFPHIPLLVKDIRDLSNIELEHLLDGKTVDLVIGGPPCQGFSIFGKRRFINTQGYKPHNDPRNALVYEYIRIVDILRPKFFFMENVKGFTNLDGGFFVNSVETRFRELGYNNIWRKIVNAADYGVPQIRQRMFMDRESY